MDVKSIRQASYRPPLGWALAAAATMLAGCATTPSPAPAQPSPQGDTSYRAVAKESMRHYQLAMGEISTGAIPSARSAPIYPPELLSSGLPPVEIEAQLIVNAEGKVSEVRIADEVQVDPQRRPFADAVRKAAMQWTFEPLLISRWAADANGNEHKVDSEARPFSAAYVFRFAWKDGKPVTDVNAAADGAR
ncbi:hypothetical protein [Dyella humicola]|uniref:hypothetical protein n=1 Tax=Dyella humicola TaxID=2992126 RepID=UPI0022511DB4|nr:hypothetical protein [Dyella humicola]